MRLRTAVAAAMVLAPLVAPTQADAQLSLLTGPLQYFDLVGCSTGGSCFTLVGYFGRLVSRPPGFLGGQPIGADYYGLALSLSGTLAPGEVVTIDDTPGGPLSLRSTGGTFIVDPDGGSFPSGGLSCAPFTYPTVQWACGSNRADIVAFAPAGTQLTGASLRLAVGRPGADVDIPSRDPRITVTLTAAPEPATLALTAAGLVVVGFGVRRRRAK